MSVAARDVRAEGAEQAMKKDRTEAMQKVIEELVEEQLEAYGHLLSPADRKLAREMLADVLATHSVTADLIELIVPAPVVEHSDEVEKEESADADEKDDKDEAAAGGTSS